MKNVCKLLAGLLLSSSLLLVSPALAPVAAAPAVLQEGVVQYSAAVAATVPASASSLPQEVQGLAELRQGILDHLHDYRQEFTLRYQGDTTGIMDYIKELLDNLPLEEEYLAATYVQIGYQASYRPTEAEINFQATYHTNREQEAWVNSRADQVIRELIHPGMSDWQKVKAINDWVVNNTRYSDRTNASPHAAYALFQEGKGVCQAYALATYQLMEKAHIPVRYVAGNGESSTGNWIDHAWNLVSVDGQWYHLDTTWNDPVSTQGDVLSYKYFLVSDEAIKADHRIKNQFNYPAAIDTRYEVMREIKNPVELSGALYYVNNINSRDFKIYALNLATWQKQQITLDNAQYLVGHNHWLYFSNYSQGGYLFRLNTQTGVTEQLNQVHSQDLSLALPYLEYYDATNGRAASLKIAELAPQIPVTGVELNRTATIELPLGGEPAQVQAVIQPAAADEQGLLWSSDNPRVATVDRGKILPTGVGTTRITATTVDGHFQADVPVTVTDSHKILPFNQEKTDPQYIWSVKLNLPVKAETVHFNSVYVENQYGEKLPAQDFLIKLDPKDPTIIRVTNQGSYARKQVYYVVVGQALESLDGKKLAQPVKMAFVIR